MTELPRATGGRQMRSKTLRCYAEGSPDSGWEAICVDLDISVQGRTFDEVFAALNESIEVYMETVNELPHEDRKRLFNRSAPFFVRMRLLFAHIKYFLFSRNSNKSRHDFVSPADVCLP